jgi:hypothetical protein
MTPYVSYQMHWAARQLTPAEQRVSDEQIGQFSASVSNALARFGRPRHRRVRRALYGSAQGACDC